MITPFGCVHRSPVAFEFLSPLPKADPWKEKIEGWQENERMVSSTYAVFNEVETPLGIWFGQSMRWIQSQARSSQEVAVALDMWVRQVIAKGHYQRDGEEDYWPSSLEVLQKNGDDCDGIAALTYRSLIMLGIPPQEVFMAIVRDPLASEEEEQHHMVVLWFDTPGKGVDPLVIESTDAMKLGAIQRFSHISGWDFLRIFNEEWMYAVRVGSKSPHVSNAP